MRCPHGAIAPPVIAFVLYDQMRHRQLNRFVKAVHQPDGESVLASRSDMMDRPLPPPPQTSAIPRMPAMKPSAAEKKDQANLERRKEIGLERRERTRARLLAAAAQVLAEHGEKKATIDDFIQAAGVARGTFYNYYQTRDEILDDLWAEVGRNPFQVIQQICAPIVDPAERLAAKTRLILKTAQGNNMWGWVVFALSLDITTVNPDLLGFPKPDLDEGFQKGRFKFNDIQAATDLIVGACRSALHALLIEERSNDYPAALSAMLLRSLGISATESQLLIRQPLPIGSETAFATVNRETFNLSNAVI